MSTLPKIPGYETMTREQQNAAVQAQIAEFMRMANTFVATSQAQRESAQIPKHKKH